MKTSVIKIIPRKHLGTGAGAFAVGAMYLVQDMGFASFTDVTFGIVPVGFAWFVGWVNSLWHR